MTIDELRAIENFLDAAAEHGMDLNAARRWVSARILGGELHALDPTRSLDSVEVECAKFLAEVEK